MQRGEVSLSSPYKSAHAGTSMHILNNFWHDLSKASVDQNFEGFNDLWTKIHDMEIHLKSVKNKLRN